MNRELKNVVFVNTHLNQLVMEKEISRDEIIGKFMDNLHSEAFNLDNGEFAWLFIDTPFKIKVRELKEGKVLEIDTLSNTEKERLMNVL